jgi:hypothetical protein
VLTDSDSPAYLAGLFALMLPWYRDLHHNETAFRQPEAQSLLTAWVVDRRGRLLATSSPGEFVAGRSSATRGVERRWRLEANRIQQRPCVGPSWTT